ncbi:MAG: CRISPR-associated protein Cas4 [Fervidobacterium sp.]|uniref:CRISPR-associated protein Cas4 n=1 Tax=Fervidobacterium sp. TaxID=1871331 RepID=UPI00404A4DE8
MVLKDEFTDIQPNWLYSFLNCHRECWLISHGIEANQDYDLLVLGRLIHQESYERLKHEALSSFGMKIDVISSNDKKLIVGEIKSSSKKLTQARWQLVYYLYILKQQGIDAEGVLLIPKERKKITVKLDESTEQELEKILNEVRQVINQEKPPKAIYKSLCRQCAYGEFCWSD